MSTARGRFKTGFDRNVWTLPIFEVGQSVYVHKFPSAVLASEAAKVRTASYNRLFPEVSGPYKIVTARYNTLLILEDGIETTIGDDPGTRAPGLNKRHRVNINDGNTS